MWRARDLLGDVPRARHVGPIVLDPDDGQQRHPDGGQRGADVDLRVHAVQHIEELPDVSMLAAQIRADEPLPHGPADTVRSA